MAVREFETLSVVVTLDSGVAPKAFRLLADGVNATTKGPIVSSAAAAALVMAQVADHHPDGLLPFDYNHDFGRAAGWFRLEARGGELWAADIQWTPAGARALAEREYRYFSPALYRNYETGAVEEIINVALTNLPATLKQTPLVASRAGARENPMNDLEKMTAERDALLAAARAHETELTALTAQVAALSSAAKQAALTSRVDAIVTAGRLTPAMRAWALTQTIESLEAFAAVAPIAAAAAPAVKSPAADIPVELTSEQIEIARQLRLDPKIFQKVTS